MCAGCVWSTNNCGFFGFAVKCLLPTAYTDNALIILPSDAVWTVQCALGAHAHITICTLFNHGQMVAVVSASIKRKWIYRADAKAKSNPPANVMVLFITGYFHCDQLMMIIITMMIFILSSANFFRSLYSYSKRINRILVEVYGACGGCRGVMVSVVCHSNSIFYCFRMPKAQSANLSLA